MKKGEEKMKKIISEKYPWFPLKRLSGLRNDPHVIPISDLSKKTIENLKKVEWHITWSNEAYVFPLNQEKKTRRSFVIFGSNKIDPNRPVAYVRYETDNPSAGQTLIFIKSEGSRYGYRRYRFNSILHRICELLKEDKKISEIEKWSEKGLPTRNLYPQRYYFYLRKK